jgi:predicted RNA-binding protein (virulence factor B family)
MIQVGQYNTLRVLRHVEFGLYLDDGKDGILLPKRFMPQNIKDGDDLEVFIYHDGDDRLIATTQNPKGIVGDIVKLRTISTTPLGAFMDWGLMKDIFVPKSQQINNIIPNGEYLVKIYIDEQTGRTAATEKFDYDLSNDDLTVKEFDEVKLTVYRRTDIGYVVIINNKHTGVLHHNEIYRNITEGDKIDGFIKKIYPKTNKIDVSTGKKGYQRVEDESSKIIRLLKENEGHLPFDDKSNPDAIYEYFQMSKKTFKMTIGNLYKKRIVKFEKEGITLIE